MTLNTNLHAINCYDATELLLNSCSCCIQWSLCCGATRRTVRSEVVKICLVIWIKLNGSV